MDFKEIDNMMFGAYKIVNRLHEIPVANELNAYIPDENKDSTPTPDFMKELMPPRAFSYYTAWYYGDKCEHGDNNDICQTREELSKRADIGVKSIMRLVEKLDFNRKLEALRKLDQFTQDTVIRKYGKWLP